MSSDSPEDSEPIKLNYQGSENEASTDDVDDPEALRQAEAELEQSLREGDQLDSSQASPPGDLQTVATYNVPAEAHMAAARLEGDGIRAFIADENLIATDWLYTNAVGGIKVQVGAADAARATELLRGLPRSSLSLNPHQPPDGDDAEDEH